MVHKPASRGSFRDRHDRGTRRPLVSRLLSGKSKSERFRQYVDNTMEYLLGLWPNELAGVSWKVLDAPKLTAVSFEIPRWEIDRDKKEIYIYRIPTERFGSSGRVSSQEERAKVETEVFEAVSELLDVDPWDLVPDRFNH